MDIDLIKATDAIFDATSIPTLRRAAFRMFRKAGFRRMAYVQTRLGHTGYSFVDQVGFPPDFVIAYMANDDMQPNRLADPFPNASRRSAFPLQWSSVTRNEVLSAQERAYVTWLRSMGMGDGVSGHVWGPSGWDGYFALGFADKPGIVPKRTLARLQLLCHAIHDMACELRPADDRKDVQLSAREAEILHWMAQGKSNAVIAEILGVSRHTVNTLVKRSFGKLGVSDRVSAVILALRLGAIPRLSPANPFKTSLK